MIFDLYWRVLGLPLSRIKGGLTDRVPFSVVELSLWMGVAACLVWGLSFAFPRGWMGRRGVRAAALLLGPVFLVALSLGQGAFPLSIAPTGLREPLPQRLRTLTGDAPLDSATFAAWARAREARLRGYFDTTVTGDQNWKAFEALPETTALRVCDASLDSVLAALRLPPGRTVRAFKDMGPWTTAMGMLYGGPAFHDPFFSEIGIISYRNYPVSHFWRLMAACHETAHAKGFTREMDAEILTQLALLRIGRGTAGKGGDPRFTALADIQFLQKTGTKITWPDSLVAEARRARAARARVEAARPALAWVRSLMRRAGLQNSGGKYGERRAAEPWNPHHPFFATIHAIAQEQP